MGDTSGQTTELVRMRLSGTIGRRELLRRARALGLSAVATTAMLVLPSGGAARTAEELPVPVPAPQNRCHDACGVEWARCAEGANPCDDAFIRRMRACGSPGPSQPLPPKRPPAPEFVGPTG